MSRARTKQVCTIGPATADKIPDLVAGGMDVARINFSHGSDDDHKAYVHAVRAAAHSARRSVAVMADLPGPKLRLGDLAGGELRLSDGATFMLLAEGRVQPLAVSQAATVADSELPTESTGSEAPVEPANVALARDESETQPDTTAHVAALATPGAIVRGAQLAAVLQVGDRVLMADGAVELNVTDVADGQVTTDVVSGGLIRSRSGVNIPSERFGDGGVTDDDRAGVLRALELRVDLLAQSYVRSAADVLALRALLPTDGPRVVAKIETRAAVDDFHAICAAADGIMVARGDLGVDIPFEDVPMIQKDLVRRATSAGRFSIVATQMLESMISAALPTRAEASDVANAVLDGADAVMLSAETAIGAHPVEALKAMERICRAAEQHVGASEATAPEPSVAITLAATMMAATSGVGAIWCFTRTGRTAELLSLQRPSVPIVAFTLSPVVARRLAVRRGVVPLVLPAGAKNVPLNDQMEAAWRAQRSATADIDSVLLVTTSSQPGGINRLEFHRLSAAATAKRA
ncbi:MAG: pyruvate kinase [Chloroflexota bacterium]